MNFKRILGTVIFICGIGLLIGAFYIKNQIEEGKLQISNAQEKVDQGSKLFSLSPATDQVGKVVSKSAQKKIDAANQEVNYYAQLANWAQTAGIIFLVLGAALFFLGRKK